MGGGKSYESQSLIYQGRSFNYDWAYIWIKKITVAIPYLSGKVFQPNVSKLRTALKKVGRNPLFIREGLSTEN